VGEFFDWHVIRTTLPGVLRGFETNLKMMAVAEICVLAWALTLALLRTAPGRSGLPARVLAIVYIDLFRGLPTIIVFYLVVFGLPIAYPQMPFAGSTFALSVVALTLSYGGYVAEVYRAGIESVHPSQAAAARSLGLSYGATMRSVVLPQAVRRVVPPLLNDFISLQKDTALASSVGVLEGLGQAYIYAGNRLSPAPIVGVSLCFVAITIPCARLTDWLLARDARRRSAAG
jgi:polar amino acid transport system permease protein